MSVCIYRTKQLTRECWNVARLFLTIMWLWAGRKAGYGYTLESFTEVTGKTTSVLCAHPHSKDWQHRCLGLKTGLKPVNAQCLDIGNTLSMGRNPVLSPLAQSFSTVAFKFGYNPLTCILWTNKTSSSEGQHHHGRDAAVSMTGGWKHKSLLRRITELLWVSSEAKVCPHWKASLWMLSSPSKNQNISESHSPLCVLSVAARTKEFCSLKAHRFNVLGGCLWLLNHCEQLCLYRPRVGQHLCMWTLNSAWVWSG